MGSMSTLEAVAKPVQWPGVPSTLLSTSSGVVSSNTCDGNLAPVLTKKDVHTWVPTQNSELLGRLMHNEMAQIIVCWQPLLPPTTMVARVTSPMADTQPMSQHLANVRVAASPGGQKQRIPQKSLQEIFVHEINRSAVRKKI